MVNRRRKNFFPTLILIFFFWTTLGLMVYFVEPETLKNILIPGLYLPFFLNLFLALFFTLAIIFINSRRGFLISLGITAFLDSLFTFGEIFRKINSVFFMLVSLGLLVRTSTKMKMRTIEGYIEKIKKLEHEVKILKEKVKVF